MCEDISRKFVFSTTETVRNRFPTHSTELIMDRSEAATSEAYWVVYQPGEASPLHVHYDMEQIFYVLRGVGELRVGHEGKRPVPVAAGNLVRIPPGTHHRVLCQGSEPLVYLNVGCFVAGKPVDEPTWETHLRTVCKENGWDFEATRNG